MVSGQKIKLFFNQQVHADAGARLIEALPLPLPLPLAIIATDIGSGERLVLRDGSLTLAMRASTSVPGLMAPLPYRGRKLVDGGLVDNVPIQEVRNLCGADVVIAVNVGSPLLKPEQIGGLVSVFGQMVNILTEQNVTQSLALLQPGDIYIRPDLGEITAGDFQRNGEAADLGRQAAQAVAAQLQRLSLDEAGYAAFQQRLRTPQQGPAMVDEIEIAGLKSVNPATVSRYVDQRLGAPLDAVALNRSLLRAYGDGSYEQVDYTLLRQHDRNVLRILPVEKSWGPDYLRLGLKRGHHAAHRLHLQPACGLPEDLDQPPGRRVVVHRRPGHRDRPGRPLVPAAGCVAALLPGNRGGRAARERAAVFQRPAAVGVPQPGDAWRLVDGPEPGLAGPAAPGLARGAVRPAGGRWRLVCPSCPASRCAAVAGRPSCSWTSSTGCTCPPRAGR